MSQTSSLFPQCSGPVDETCYKGFIWKVDLLDTFFLEARQRSPRVMSFKNSRIKNSFWHMFPYHLTVVAEDSRNYFVIDVSSYMFNERLHFQMETSKPCFKRHVTATVLLKYWMLASIQTPCWRLSKHHVGVYPNTMLMIH